MSDEETIAELGRKGMQTFHQLRADGSSFPEACRFLEGLIRTVWPFRREWKFLCLDCEDTGWRMREREVAIYGGRLVPYAERCTCHAGQRLQAKDTDDRETLAKIGRTGTPTRIGRW